MVLTPSQMLPLGTTAPDFDLPDASGARHSLARSKGAKAFLVCFMCNHCPFVKHIRSELAALGRDCRDRGVAMFGINSNDTTTHPDDAPAAMLRESEAAGYTFPYLVDADQSVAKAYRAACTPDFYLFDANRKLVYRGQLDDSRPGNDVPVTGVDLRAAIDAVLAQKPVAKEQKASIGCNIKWLRGREPEWFPA
jgi:peroxiredoxin